MQSLSEQQLLRALVALGVIILCARGFGELARRLRQPEVLGQIFAGFILGPSVVGLLLPALEQSVFLDHAVDNGFSLLSWIGAILLLLVAGLEVDAAILRTAAKPGAFAAVGAIGAGLVAGTLFALLVLGEAFASAFFLGIVFSVTGVSVAATILIEQGVMRRSYAQVVLAAGVASEVLVWVLVSIVSSTGGPSPVLAALSSAITAAAVFLFMLTLERRFTFWVMRRVADSARIARGPISLVLVLTFLTAALTQALHLHPLLGAFLFGVLLMGAPRIHPPLVQSLQTLTFGLFAPIFFVLAGMRIDVSQLGGLASIGQLALLFVVLMLAKAGCGSLGARLGGLRGWQSALVGVGLNLKGSTDVIVAVIGTNLGLLSARLYTMYAVIAMLTVLVSPPLLLYLGKKAPPSTDEMDRLRREEAEQHAYVQRVQRVLVPLAPLLLPSLAASVVECIAATKHRHRHVFDVTEFVLEQTPRPEPVSSTGKALQALSAEGALLEIELTQRQGDGPRGVSQLFDLSRRYDLVVIGARPPQPAPFLSFGDLQDGIIAHARTDILIVVGMGDSVSCDHTSRILVPINGLAHSLVGGDVAAYLAGGYAAEIVLLHVISPTAVARFEHDRALNQIGAAGSTIVQNLAARVGDLGVRVSYRTRIGEDAGAEVLHELDRASYQLVVMGAINRGAEHHPYLGSTVQTILTQARPPLMVVVSRGVGDPAEP